MKFTGLITGLLGLSGGVTGIYYLTETQSTLSSTSPNYLKDIEIHFYDKSSGTAKLKTSLDDLGSPVKFSYFDTTDSKYKGISSLTGDDKKDEISKYSQLAKLAGEYVRTQHFLNIIKASSWQKNPDQSSTNSTSLKCSCKDKKCCCDNSDPKKCCIFCLCCYSKNSSVSTDTDDCSECCKNGECKLDDLKKQSNLFWYHLSNLSGTSKGVYMSPVQAHIKLMDADLSNDFKSQTTSESSDSSTSTAKKLSGMLVYGFVDYYWKETAYTDSGFASNISSSIEVSDESDSSSKSYYSNVPQQFTFDIKTKKTSSSESGSSSTIQSTDKEKSNKLSDVFDLVSDKKIILEKSKNNENTSEIKCCLCCEQEKSLDCILSRNYSFKMSNLDIPKTKFQSSSSSQPSS